MANSKKTWHWWINALAFVAVVLIGICLFLSDVLKVGGGDLTTLMYKAANALAYIVAAACSFVFVAGMRGKKRLIYVIIWAVAIVLIAIAYIRPLF